MEAVHSDCSRGYLGFVGTDHRDRLLVATTETDQSQALELPQEINPFTVLGLLQKIQSQATLRDSHRGELADSIRNVQQYYFAPQNGHPSVQWEEIACNWLKRVS